MSNNEAGEAGVKIRRASVRDYQRIKWVELKPQGAVIVVGGKNGNGKSSLINALIAGIGGRKFLSEQPVRAGAERTETVIELGSEDTTEFTIRQFMTADNRYGLEVKSKDGFVHPKGQTFLDTFYSKLSFDPLEFVHAKPKERVDIMNKALGLDFSALDYQRKQAFDERTIVNRDVASLESQARAKSHNDDVPAEPLTSADLVQQLEDAIAHNSDIEQAASRIAAAERRAGDLAARQEALRIAAAELRKQAEAKELEAEQTAEEESVLRAQNSQAKETSASAEPIDVAAIREQLATIDTTNRMIAENKALAELQKKLAAARRKSDDFSKIIGRIDQDKETKLQKAKFPVQGIKITEDGIQLNGFPFEQASSAEQLRVSLNVAFLLKSNLRVLFTKEGGSLDDVSFAIMNEEAERAGVQIIVELPTRTPLDEEFASIVIEDGLARGAESPPTAENFLDGVEDE